MKPHILRARLPNGVTVAIDTANHIPDDLHVSKSISSSPEDLSRLLSSRDTTEVELIHFLSNILPAVLPEADPASRPRFPRSARIGPHERELGVDIIFNTQQGNQGFVETKTHRWQASGRSREELMVTLQRLLHVPAHWEVGYIIAGRRRHLARLKDISEQFTDYPWELQIVSWDDIADRLHVSSENGTPEFTVVLFEIVNMSRRLLSRLAHSPALLAGIDDRKFEELVATLLSELGFDEVMLTPPRQDGGRDIVFDFIDEATAIRSNYVMECKHWTSGNKVTTRWAIKLLHVMRKEKAKGILLSSSSFGPRLLEQEAEFRKEGLHIRDSADLHQWISVWQRQYGGVLFEPVDPRQVLSIDE